MNESLLSKQEASLSQPGLITAVVNHESTVFGHIAQGKADAKEWAEAAGVTAVGVAAAAAIAYSPSLLSKGFGSARAAGTEIEAASASGGALKGIAVQDGTTSLSASEPLLGSTPRSGFGTLDSPVGQLSRSADHRFMSLGGEAPKGDDLAKYLPNGKNRTVDETGRLAAGGTIPILSFGGDFTGAAAKQAGAKGAAAMAASKEAVGASGVQAKAIPDWAMGPKDPHIVGVEPDAVNNFANTPFGERPDWYPGRERGLVTEEVAPKIWPLKAWHTDDVVREPLISWGLPSGVELPHLDIRKVVIDGGKALENGE